MIFKKGRALCFTDCCSGATALPWVIPLLFVVFSLVRMSDDDSRSSHESDSEETPKKEEPKVVYTKDYDLHAQRMPTKERIVAEVEMPPAHPLSDDVFWNPDKKPNVSAIKEHLRKEGRLSLAQAHGIIEQVYEVFCAEENVLAVPAPVTGPHPLDFCSLRSISTPDRERAYLHHLIVIFEEFPPHFLWPANCPFLSRLEILPLSLFSPNALVSSFYQFVAIFTVNFSIS